MAVGFLSQSTKFNLYTLVDAAADVTAAPTLVTDGIDISGVFGSFTKIDWGVVLVKSTGTGAQTAQGRLWGWVTELEAWFPLGIGGDSTKGLLNGGVTFGGTTNNLHSEPVYAISGFDRVALQVTVLTGTGKAVSAWLAIPREVS